MFGAVSLRFPDRASAKISFKIDGLNGGHSAQKRPWIMNTSGAPGQDLWESAHEVAHDGIGEQPPSTGQHGPAGGQRRRIQEPRLGSGISGASAIG